MAFSFPKNNDLQKISQVEGLSMGATSHLPPIG